MTQYQEITAFLGSSHRSPPQTDGPMCCMPLFRAAMEAAATFYCLLRDAAATHWGLRSLRDHFTCIPVLHRTSAASCMGWPPVEDVGRMAHTGTLLHSWGGGGGLIGTLGSGGLRCGAIAISCGLGRVTGVLIYS